MFMDREKISDEFLRTLVKDHWRTENFGVTVSTNKNLYSTDEN